MQYLNPGALLIRRPHAVANIIGNDTHPQLRGQVSFYQTNHGILVSVQVFGLPGSSFLGFHIHSGGQCAQPAGHYNPQGLPHPQHAGDLPPLLSNNGYAYMSVLTNRFRLEDILGRTVIIHAMPDDFTTQPAGDSGDRIACGVITLYNAPVSRRSRPKTPDATG